MPAPKAVKRTSSGSKAAKPRRPRSPMSALLLRVEEAGFSKKFARAALPSWWADSMSNSETGLAHGALFISRRLGIEVESLTQPGASVALAQMGKVCFKTGLVAEALRPSTSVAISTARLLARSVDVPFDAATLPGSAVELRKQLLALNPVVTLDSVLAWCWDKGIPVLHLKQLPGKKPQALCLFHKGRPYIFLCDGHNLSAWQVFHLLHELAHICLRHVNEKDSLCVDEKINRADTQNEEADANAFAIEALLGGASIRVLAEDWTTAEALTDEARALGRKLNLDAGALILNAFHHDKQKERAGRNMLAVKMLESDPPALQRIRHEANRRLNWEEMDEENQEYVRELLGLVEEDQEATPAA